MTAHELVLIEAESRRFIARCDRLVEDANADGMRRNTRQKPDSDGDLEMALSSETWLFSTRRK